MARRTGPPEAREMGSFLRRTMRAMTRRVEGGELDALIELIAIEHEVRAQIEASLLAAVDVADYSQGFIARELGVSQQAVQRRVLRARTRAISEQAQSAATAA